MDQTAGFAAGSWIVRQVPRAKSNKKAGKNPTINRKISALHYLSTQTQATLNAASSLIGPQAASSLIAEIEALRYS
jgi:hypothetical protein